MGLRCSISSVRLEVRGVGLRDLSFWVRIEGFGDWNSKSRVWVQVHNLGVGIRFRSESLWGGGVGFRVYGGGGGGLRLVTQLEGVGVTTLPGRRVVRIVSTWILFCGFKFRAWGLELRVKG